MVPRGNRQPSAPESPASVQAPTLKQAMRRARMLYGDDVRILSSRTLWRRQEGSLGGQKLVEILIDAPSDLLARQPRQAPVASESPLGTSPLIQGITAEVSRIERLVRTLSIQRGGEVALAPDLHRYPLATPLLNAGTTAEATGQMAQLFAAEYEDLPADLTVAMEHLRRHLKAGSGSWLDFTGKHVFLGDAGVGKSNLLLALAAKLQAAGRRTLVLDLLPQNKGQIRRLQLEAAARSFDAAMIQRVDQLIRFAEQMDRYDVVLMDTPSIFTATMAKAGELQDFISQNESWHRHLVVPMDLDLCESGEIWQAARSWSCDWTDITRCDRSRCPGKVLDIQLRSQLPVALCMSGPWPEIEPNLADQESLARLIIGDHLPQFAATAHG